MPAVYPNAIKRWANKINRRDDIDASHINELQDEVTAIEEVLGIVPQFDRTPDEPTPDYSGDFKDIRDRIDALARGFVRPICYLEAPQQHLPVSPNVAPPGNWRFINFSAPAASRYDPMRMYNGAGVTLNSSGWWIITSDVRWQPNPNGARIQGITLNGVEVAGDTVNGALQWTTHVDARTNVVWQGPARAGTKVSMFLALSAPAEGLTVRAATLSVSSLRDIPGL